MIKMCESLTPLQYDFGRDYMKLNDFGVSVDMVLDYHRPDINSVTSILKEYINEKGKREDGLLRLLVTGNNYDYVKRERPISNIPGVGKTSSVMFMVKEFDDFISVGNGTALYSKSLHTLYIPVDLQVMNLSWGQRANYIEFVLNDIEKYIDMADEEYKDIIRERHIESMSTKLEKYMQGSLEMARNDLENALRNIEHNKAIINKEVRRRDNALKEVKLYEEDSEVKISKLKRELSSIMDLKYVNSIEIYGSIFEVKVKRIPAHVSDGNMILLPEMSINIDMDNSSIRFLGDEDDKKPGFWRSLHPHVNDRGEACYGNVDATIAELSGQQELLALTTILINYLESVNADDAAGAGYNAWDRIDPDTHEIIQIARDECSECGKLIIDSDGYNCEMCGDVVCGDCTFSINSGDMIVCTNCYEYETYYCELCDESHPIGTESRCERCDVVTCEDNITVVDGENVCSVCLEEQRERERQEEQEEEIDIHAEENLMTCEVCGSRDTREEIYMCGDGVFRCSTCRQ